MQLCSTYLQMNSLPKTMYSGVFLGFFFEENDIHCPALGLQFGFMLNVGDVIHTDGTHQ